jgi:hypothetical protein
VGGQKKGGVDFFGHLLSCENRNRQGLPLAPSFTGHFRERSHDTGITLALGDSPTTVLSWQENKRFRAGETDTLANFDVLRRRRIAVAEPAPQKIFFSSYQSAG